MYAWDRVFVEIQLFLMLLVSIPVIYTVQAGEAPTFTDIPSVLIASALLASICAIELGCLLSIVRIIESRLLHRRLLTWIVLKWIGRGVRGLARVLKSGFDGRNPLAKTIILVVLFWFVMAISAAVFYDGEFGIAGFMMLAALALALYLSVRWAARYGELKRGVEKIAGGDLAYKIPVPDGAASEFDKLSLKVNEIGSATELAMQSEIRNQRLKTDLISNVSHDLKTPLTSIITYTDLLKKEGADSANAAEYIGIIEEKSHRLKKLTEDLFEAAKASSGAMPVRREKVDLLSLINQDLVELGDGLAGIGLNVIVGAEKEHYYVNADSQLLWRVVDNLLNNVRKYAMPGSRVYIELKDYSGGAPLAGRGTTSLEIKNISAAGLNIPAEELMERFKRGDDSRATEGSGLGLSIAKDLVRLMDGRFDISIDGDLFKATMTLASWVGG
jgi:signal transduction histidine kinase